MKTRVEGLMQVGGWYWQTDRIELYASGTMKDTLFHANDNVLKMYHNNTEVENTVIWKSENGPAIQPGWLPRDLQNVHVKDTYIIHNKTGVKLENYTVGGAPHQQMELYLASRGARKAELRRRSLGQIERMVIISACGWLFWVFFNPSEPANRALLLPAQIWLLNQHSNVYQEICWRRGWE